MLDAARYGVIVCSLDGTMAVRRFAVVGVRGGRGGQRLLPFGLAHLLREDGRILRIILPQRLLARRRAVVQHVLLSRLVGAAASKTIAAWGRRSHRCLGLERSFGHPLALERRFRHRLTLALALRIRRARGGRARRVLLRTWLLGTCLGARRGRRIRRDALLLAFPPRGGRGYLLGPTLPRDARRGAFPRRDFARAPFRALRGSVAVRVEYSLEAAPYGSAARSVSVAALLVVLRRPRSLCLLGARGEGRRATWEVLFRCCAFVAAAVRRPLSAIDVERKTGGRAVGGDGEIVLLPDIVFGLVALQGAPSAVGRRSDRRDGHGTVGWRIIGGLIRDFRTCLGVRRLLAVHDGIVAGSRASFTGGVRRGCGAILGRRPKRIESLFRGDDVRSPVSVTLGVGVGGRGLIGVPLRPLRFALYRRARGKIGLRFRRLLWRFVHASFGD
mmetsp:Transcript_35938/g.107377  ORF Transcript_35938/g.107377 Transcript_35938/m.107377 type:complete len:444 (-) Transcript_35938:375-1706(-)